MKKIALTEQSLVGVFRGEIIVAMEQRENNYSEQELQSAWAATAEAGHNVLTDAGIILTEEEEDELAELHRAWWYGEVK